MTPPRRLRILHLILVLGETNSQYNEHCLPVRHERDLAICTYFVPKLDPPPEIKLFAGDGTLRGFFRAFRAALDEGDYDAIHAHSPQMGTFVTLALLAWPQLRRRRRSTVYTVHDSFNDFKLRNKLLMVPPLAVFHRVVFCGHGAYDSFPSLWRRRVGQRGSVIQNGADYGRVDRVLAQRGGSDGNGSFTLVSAARLEPVKDPLTLLAAFRRSGTADGRLVFLGAGALESDLDRQIEHSGIKDRVTRAGVVPRDDVFSRFAEAALFVSTSRGEGLPVAALEAMATGCPVLLSDIPPHREVAERADFIPLVAPGDVVGFAREIARFRALTPAERRAIGEKCSRLARERFSVQRMNDGYERLYRGMQ